MADATDDMTTYVQAMGDTLLIMVLLMMEFKLMI